MKRIWFLVLILVSIVNSSSAMKISGNLRIAKPTEIEIIMIDGTSVLKIPIKTNGNFESATVKIVPDTYFFKVGDSKEIIYLDNQDITINGYLDAASNQNSQLEFTGMDANERFIELYQWYVQEGKVPSSFKTLMDKKKLEPNLISALAVLNLPVTYEDSKSIFDLIPKETTINASYKVLSRHVDSLSLYRIGGPAPQFSLMNEKGKMVKLSDFKGKYVVLDFWASWCGPCKNAIKMMKEFYPEYMNSNIVFVGISLDETKEKWTIGAKEVGLPWTNLWDASGGFYKTKFKEQYGFKGIPFVVIIDKQGNLLVRGVRADRLHNELKKLK